MRKLNPKSLPPIQIILDNCPVTSLEGVLRSCKKLAVMRFLSADGSLSTPKGIRVYFDDNGALYGVSYPSGRLSSITGGKYLRQNRVNALRETSVVR